MLIKIETPLLTWVILILTKACLAVLMRFFMESS